VREALGCVPGLPRTDASLTLGGDHPRGAVLVDAAEQTRVALGHRRCCRRHVRGHRMRLRSLLGAGARDPGCGGGRLRSRGRRHGTGFSSRARVLCMGFGHRVLISAARHGCLVAWLIRRSVAGSPATTSAHY
jgi:hypothetical protein